MPPFEGANMRVHLCPPHDAWKLFFFAVSEKDLEEAVASLPDIGMSAVERKEEIEKIDIKISGL
jgi:hypothetical protein